MYSKVHQLREAGFSQRAIAKALGINRKTVKRYWDMDVEQYEHNARKIVRIRNLDTHRDQIVSWLREYPSLSAAQVCDWLKEHYEEDHAERTVSRYVKELREEYHLPRHPNPRSYEAVAELPMGQQMQVDFGQTTLKNVDGTWTKIYVAVFLLSHSRYKMDAIFFCMGSNLCSTNTVRGYLEHRAEEKAMDLPFVYPSQIPVNDPKYHITTQKRPLAVYAKVGGQV